MTGASINISTALSLLGSLDPYWESQLLVEYSKNLFTCKVLDGQVIYERYRVVDGVIYFHDQIYLIEDSKLKKEILHVAYEAFFLGHVDSIDSYHTIMEGFYWDNLKEDVHQHIRIYVAFCFMKRKETTLKFFFSHFPF